ncbi:MAG TPA: hypothetical protein VLY03_10450 [Bacteroidota bacterium]|nr:hypothetical protein [Bacteroidota bacterium]
MRTTILVFIISILITCSFPIHTVRGGDYDRRSALAEINTIIDKAEFNLAGLYVIKHYAENATCNFSAIVSTARLASEFGYHTVLLVLVAKVASETDHECPYLTQIASFVVRNPSANSGLIELAELAGRAKTGDEFKDVDRAMEKADHECAYMTLDEARSHQQHPGN